VAADVDELQPPGSPTGPAELEARAPFGLQGSGYGIFAGCWAALLPVAFLSTSAYPSFVPKYAVLLVMAAAGLVPLARLAWRESTRRLGLLLVGFLAVGLLSALLSAAPNVGIFGLYRWGTGWLFWLSCAGAFAVGTSLRGKDLDWAFNGLLVGSVANALMAVFQIVVKPSSAALAAYAGNSQADGFLGNPIHLEALMLGAIALVATKVCDAPRRWWWAPLLFGVALEMTSERLFIPVLVAIFAVVVWTRGKRGLLFSALASAGCLIGYVAGGSALGTRVASGTAETTFGLRFQLWRTALDGLAHHPLIGSGPGELLAGTAPFINQSFGKALDGRLFTDAHDFLVEVLVTTGIVGFALFAGWLGLSLRRCRGPFLAFALALMSVKLVEPLDLGAVPLAFLALGAGMAGWLSGREEAPLASEVPAALRPESLQSRVTSVLAVLLALVLAATMLIGDYWYSKTQTGLQQLTAARRANEYLPYWAESSAALGFYWRYEYSILHDSARRVDLLRARQDYVTTVGRDPSDPTVWWFLGEVDQLLGRSGAAEAAYEHSLREDPWFPLSLGSLAGLQLDEHHWSAAASLYEQLARVQPLSKRDRTAEREAKAHLSAGRS
jgi:O-antigen ligase